LPFFIAALVLQGVYMTVEAIDFQLDRPQNSGEIAYRPYGVTTIRLKITSESKDQPALRLRVGRKKQSDIDEGTFRGFPNDTESLMVSWGGGHEEGPCVKPKDFFKFREDPHPLPCGEKSYIYFNLTYIDERDLPDSAVLTIEAYDIKDNSVVSTLAINLKKPSTVPEQVRRLVPHPDLMDTWKIQSGTHLPAYDPRWFPEGVSYSAVSDPLPLTIRHIDNTLKLYWGDADEPLAVLTDNTNPSLLTAGDHQREYRNTVLFEVFDFDEHHIALRTWFYWLNKQIGGKYFVGGHEVPDAERFDFLLRKNDGSPVFVCTDLHWSEMWGEVPKPPLEVSLGISRAAVFDILTKNANKAREMAKEKLNFSEKSLMRALEAPFKWLPRKKYNEQSESDGGGSEEPSDAETPHNPIGFIRERAAARYEKEIDSVRDKGSEAHVPWMHGVIEYHRSDLSKRNLMVSNDVRLVFEAQ
jgi:hypothetical protein